MEASITLKKVGKTLNGQSVLAGLSFGVEKGSIMAIVGPNGAGKTTLLRILAGLASPEFGNVFINGLDILERSQEVKRITGYMPQIPNFDPQLTIRENLLLQGLLYKLPKSLIKNQMKKLANIFQIGDVLDKMPESISYGHLKRALLVRALIHNPQILILDELTASLDIQSKYVIWDYLHKLKYLPQQEKKTVIYTTHSMEEAEKLHDRITILHRGKVVLEGSLFKLVEEAGDLSHYQIQFETLSDELYSHVSQTPDLINPSRIGNVFDFYGKGKKVFFEVIKNAGHSELIDFQGEKIGLETIFLSSTYESEE